MSNTGGDDPIYRGQPPQDGVPLEPYIPPTNSPAYAPPPPGGPAAPAKKKRWPLIVGALVLFCGLPLGGCVALIGLGFSEISERNDAIEAVVDQYVLAVLSDDADAIAALTDGNAPCDDLRAHGQPTPSESLPDDAFEVSRISFTDRSDNSTFSSNAGENGITIEGREGESAARVVGVYTGLGPSPDVEIMLTKPLANWKVCTVTER